MGWMKKRGRKGGKGGLRCAECKTQLHLHNSIPMASIHEVLPVNSTTIPFPNKNRTTFPRPSRHTPLHANPIPPRHRVNAVCTLLCPQPPLFMGPLTGSTRSPDPTLTAKCQFPSKPIG